MKCLHAFFAWHDKLREPWRFLFVLVIIVPPILASHWGLWGLVVGGVWYIFWIILRLRWLNTP